MLPKRAELQNLPNFWEQPCWLISQNEDVSFIGSEIVAIDFAITR